MMELSINLKMNNGYDLVDGSKDTAIGIKPTPRGKKTTHLPNYSTVTDFAKFLG